MAPIDLWPVSPPIEDAVDRAARSGFDEVVVYWPMGQEGSPLWADPDVVVAAVAAVRA